MLIERRISCGLRSCPQGLNKNQNESPAQSDQTTIDLLFSRRTCGCANFLSPQTARQHQRRGDRHDRGQSGSDTTDDTDDSKSNTPLILITLLVAGGIGAIVFFKKKKASAKTAPRMEDFDYEYDDEDEEEIEEEKPPVCNEAVQKKGKWDGML